MPKIPQSPEGGAKAMTADKVFGPILSALRMQTSGQASLFWRVPITDIQSAPAEPVPAQVASGEAVVISSGSIIDTGAKFVAPVIGESMNPSTIPQDDFRFPRGGHVVVPTTITNADPQDAAFEETLSVIRQAKGSILVKQAVKTACRNEQVRLYLGGHHLTQRENKKYRVLVERLRTHPNIQVTNLKPLKVRWVGNK